jgi:hypothetical protein
LEGLGGLRGARREPQHLQKPDAPRSPAELPQPGGNPMTTEIAIMNRQGIALAADSAVTVGRQRVWKTANKLFSLAPHNDIAVMAYGSGDFISFPWETIIKSFRLQVGPKKFKTVKECADELIQYLKSDVFENSGSETVSIYLVFSNILERMKTGVGDYKKPGGYTSKKEFRTKIDTHIRALKQVLQGKKIILTALKLKDFKATYEQMILDVAKDKCKEHITQKMLKDLVDVCFEVFRRDMLSSYETGLVIAGFGSNEFFPAVITYMIDGKHNKTLRAWINDNYCHDVNDSKQSEGVILPFGQSDVALLFLDGIVRQNLRYVSRSIRLMLEEKSKSLIDKYVSDAAIKITESATQKQDNRDLLKQFDEEFQKYRDKNIVQPIMRVVSTLPKEEMAAMAEALVELTSLRRKVDSHLESVGGPTDVALISKGDGLIWMKRKHYFDIAKNRDFDARKELQIRGNAL